MGKKKPEISVVVADFDNTLYDWVDMWYKSFTAMLSELARDSGISEEVLMKESQRVFQKYGTSEYAFAIQELPSLKHKYPNENLARKFSSAIHAYRKARKKALKLYPTVIETLLELKSRGCLLVGYSESMAFYVDYRTKTLGLDEIFDYIYTPPDHDLPKGTSRAGVRHYPSEHYQLRHAIHKHTPKGVSKPSKEVLLDIIRDVGADPHETIYVGDHLLKDVVMAKEADVIDVYAKYGVAQNRSEYELLRRVTHWPTDAVENEKQIDEAEINPSYVLKKNFKELLKMFRFKRFVEPIKKVDKTQMHALIEVWKKTVDVQQHFNDLELRIRNYAITLIVATLGAASLIENQRIRVIFLGHVTPLATILVMGGLAAWFAFYFMDRYWYHKLLFGSVEHGRYIETRLRRIMPELKLASTIAEASPLKIPWTNMELHSWHKLDVFYGLMGIFLIVLAWVPFLIN
jgi:phosphoglycolate phosphatase-like HAD superfamily hydrolase